MTTFGDARPGATVTFATTSLLGRPAAALRCMAVQRRSGGRLVVDGLTLEIDAGEAFGLFSPDTAAVAATVAMVCGLLPVDGGTVLLQGRPVHTMDRRQLATAVGYVAREVVVAPEGSILANMRFWARVVGVDTAARRTRTAEVLDLAGLDAHGDERAGRCPPDVLARLSVAVALLHRPPLLVMAGPLDRIALARRPGVVALLDKLRGHGIALLLAGPEDDAVRALCDRVGELRSGRTLGKGHPRPAAVRPTLLWKE
jgi:ABC-type multidrug transport system ATPase subunit